MKALITGSAGLVGHALVKELASAEGYQVIEFSRGQVDLRNFEATRSAFEEAQPEIVFHLAAKVGGLGGNMAAPGLFYFENATINSNVIEAARLSGVRKVVAMGSSACYSDTVGLPMREAAIWDGPPHQSEAAYAHSKRGMLAQLEAYRIQYGLDYAFCIATNMFGANDKFDETHGHVVPTLISKFAKAARSSDTISVWGTGTPRRDFLYTKDVARFMREIGERFTGAINLASGSTITIQQLVETLQRVSGYEGRVNWDASKPNGQELRGYDISKLTELGLTPAYDFESALSETYAWFIANEANARR